MATTVVPISTNESLMQVHATAPKYMKGASDLTFRKRLWLAMLMRYGGVEYNANSFSQTWSVEMSQPEVRQYGANGDLQFNEHDALDSLTVNVRGYTATDRLGVKDNLMNSGNVVIDDLYKNKSKRLVKRVRQVLNAELYTDGDATNNANRFAGIETFMGYTACAATDIIAKPNDSYAGKSTVLGAQGGTWSATLGAGNFPNASLANDFPYGKGSSEWDYLGPLLVNTASTRFMSGVPGFGDNCEEILRFSRQVQVARGAKGDDSRTPFVHMLSTDYMTAFQNYFSARNRQSVPHPIAANLGFGETMNFEGDIVYYEQDTPPSSGYGISPTMMEMFVLGPQLLTSVGPEFAIERLGYLYLVYLFGNLRFQPKFFAKYADFTS